MNNKEYFIKLSDYLILNGYSKNSSGLYYGKAGVAIGLFELSRYLQDERIEEHAFEILNQSLLSKTEICDLEKGLSGIAYVLRYLIENRFIEADVKELFGNNLDKIEKYIGVDSFEWNDKMNQLYSFIYTFSKEDILCQKSTRENVEHLWKDITEELLKDLIQIHNIESPLTLEIHQNFVNWMQWIKRTEQRGISLKMNKNLLSQTIEKYCKIRDAGLLVASPQADYYFSDTRKIFEKELLIPIEGFSIHDQMIQSFCSLSNADPSKPFYTKGDYTERSLQHALFGNKCCSSLYGGIIQLLLYEIAVLFPDARGRLSELILLPNLHSIKETVKPH